MNSKLSGKSDTNHSHSWSSITNRPSTFTPSSHSHGWGDITGKPSTYTPSSHTHDDRYYTESEINNKGFVSSTANGYIHVNTINKFSDSDNILYGCSNGRNYIVAVTIWSDEKLKTNINDSDINAIDMINKIKLHEFDFVNKEYGNHNSCGYIAQELKSIFPESVIDVPQDKEITGYDSLYQIDDSKLIPYLVKAIQELSAEIEELKKK